MSNPFRKSTKQLTEVDKLFFFISTFMVVFLFRGYWRVHLASELLNLSTVVLAENLLYLIYRLVPKSTTLNDLERPLHIVQCLGSF